MLHSTDRSLRPRSVRPALPSVALIAAAALVAGCSSVPEPVAEIASARTAIRNTQGTDARRLAPVELDRAETKLRRAEAAVRDERNEEARMLALQAGADAELAAARANAEKAERSAQELDESIRVLRSEIERARTTR